MGGVNKTLYVAGHQEKEPSGPWQPRFPNPADVPYNYFNLLDRTKKSGIANVAGRPESNARIAIIGAGYGGMTIARELYRSGFTNLSIYEATQRIGGRAYTILPRRSNEGPKADVTPYELGAMRIPFFSPDPSGSGGPGNSTAAYYA